MEVCDDFFIIEPNNGDPKWRIMLLKKARGGRLELVEFEANDKKWVVRRMREWIRNNNVKIIQEK